MRTSMAMVLAVIMAFTMVAPAFAQTNTTVIPRYTVIPVTLQQNLSSATNRVGDTFQAVCSTNCGGFPSGTVFTGRVTSVVKSTSDTPGQLEVSFFRAVLPNNSSISITGTLTSLNRNDVTTDPNTGRLVQRSEVRNQRNRFIAYGAGLGLLIGVLGNGNAFRGALIGALAGYLAGTTLGRQTRYSDVTVASGTEFGIALQREVTLTTSAGAGTGTGPTPNPTPTPSPNTPAMTINFEQYRPYQTTGGVVMTPFREVMRDIDQPFTYSASRRAITIDTAEGRVTHTVGSNVAYLDGQRIGLSARSRNVNGTLYVPSDLIGVITGRDVVWQPGTGTLVIR